MPLVPNPNHQMGFQASFLRYLLSKHSSLETHEPHPRILPATWQYTIPAGSAQNPHSKKNPTYPAKATLTIVSTPSHKPAD